jgi:uncharacterized protein (TIGR03083 family)
MANADAWTTIHAERKALLADLEPLTDAQWATPSLCPGWSVRDVLAHMVATAKVTPPKFFAGMVGAGFRFNSFSEKGVAANRGASPADTLAGLRSELTATTHPPGPLEAMVGEAVVHSEDIRRPLGISHTFPTDVLGGVADFYKSSNLLIGGKKRVAGLTLRATDADWSSGSGPEVSGPMLALVLAVAGRRTALDDLSGDGLATLKTRL